MKRLLLIYNPKSGKGLISAKIANIIEVMTVSGYEVTVHPTQSRGDATKYVDEHAGEYQRIVCCGGDGTLNEVTKGLVANGSDVVLGYIPAGSTNDYGMSLGFDSDVIRSAHIACGDKVGDMDYGKFNDNNFVYVAAFGVFSEASYATDQVLKNIFGRLAYITSAVKTLADIPEYSLEIEADGLEISGKYIYGMITNSLRVGGIRDLVKGDVKFDDGLFEVMLVKAPANPMELTEIGATLANLIADSKNVQTFRAKNITIKCEDEIAWSLDGEFGGKVNTARISCMQKAFKLAFDVDESQYIEIM